MTQLVTWVTVLPSCCSITTPAETTMVSLFFNRGILQFAREHETWVRLLDHVTQVHPTVLSFSQKIHVWTVLVFLMDRSKLKHNFGTVLQLISFFFSSLNSAPLVAISSWIQGAAVVPLTFPCCLLSKGCASFSLFAFKFLFQHLLTGFLSYSFHWMTLSVHTLHQETDGLESGCGLNLLFSQHCPFREGFPSPEWSLCVFTPSVTCRTEAPEQSLSLVVLAGCRVAEQEHSGKCSSLTWLVAGGLPVSPAPWAGHLLSRPGCLLCSKLF